MSSPPPPDLFAAKGVLRNKFTITDAERLKKVERLMTGQRAAELRSRPELVGSTFDFDRLKATHRYIFQDLYDWAGQPRTWDTAKQAPDGKLSHFIAGDEVQQTAAALFDRIAADDYLDGYEEDTPRVLAAFYSDLNVLHAFHEGNGRTNRMFTRHLARERGYDLDPGNIDKAALLNATIQAGRGDRLELAELFMTAATPFRAEELNPPNLAVVTEIPDPSTINETQPAADPPAHRTAGRGHRPTQK